MKEMAMVMVMKTPYLQKPYGRRGASMERGRGVGRSSRGPRMELCAALATPLLPPEHFTLTQDGTPFLK